MYKNKILGGSTCMKELRILTTKRLLTLFICFVMLSGCATGNNSTNWKCFDLDSSKGCQNYYDRSFTKTLDGSIATIDFTAEEFKGDFTVEKLCRAIKADGFRLSLKAPENTLIWLNEILKVPDFFDKVLEKKEIIMYTPEAKKFVHLTSRYRSKSFETSSEEEQGNIKRLNRLMIENVYSQESPKAKFIIAVRSKLFCNEEEKKDYLESRKKKGQSDKGYENLKYSTFELDIDCLNRQYRVQGQFDYNDRDEKLDGQAFPFSDWQKIDATIESIYQWECNPAVNMNK